MKRLLNIISLLSLVIAGILFYERITWTNPSTALMYGNYLTESFVYLTNTVTGLEIQSTPKHDTAISLVNIFFASGFLVASTVLYLQARKKH